MKKEDIPEAVQILRKAVAPFKEPAVGKIARRSRSPFKILVSCLISLRTKEEVTRSASGRLFQLAETPEEMMRLAPETISREIYPAGFYRTKASRIREISEILVEKYKGKVPSSRQKLLSLPGVGQKTANLVLSAGFGKAAICVDTHVHRISNRWGLVKTGTPIETEKRLEEILPKRFWKEINTLLVVFGQNICTPISPRCGSCPLSAWCAKAGVSRHR